MSNLDRTGRRAKSGSSVIQFELPDAGSASPEVAKRAHDVWIEAAVKAGIDLSGFNPCAPLANRIAWAKLHGLSIAAVLVRFSSRLQHSTTDQVLDNVRYAADHKMYAPSELICVDEGISGRKLGRAGVERMKAILRNKSADVLLVFKVSRLFRVAYRGYEFFQNELVEEGLRGISITQGIDTNDEKTWKLLCQVHGIMDELLLTAIADHVRSGLGNLFRDGFVVGALPVGYFGKEVPGARPTNTGCPRKAPSVDPQVAKLIVQHFELIRDGLSIREGWRRWMKAGGPSDPRAKSKHMSYGSYRRMLSNPRYIGRWAFGRKRNVWSSKLDYMRQLDRPETEIIVVDSDELRIVDDELFFTVQKRLASLKLGPRGPRKQQGVQLWDLVTDCFTCSQCTSAKEIVRFYVAGANGRGMRCKRAVLCPSLTVVRRKEAVRAVCKKLNELLQQDRELIEQTVTCARQLDATVDDNRLQELAGLDQKITVLKRKIDDLMDLAGEGTEEDRAATKSKVRGAKLERASLQAEYARQQQSVNIKLDPIPAERVHGLLKNLTKLLEDGAAGKLGEDAVYRAAAVFRQLVGGRIDVHVEPRPARKQSNVRGSFVPALLQTVQGELRDYRTLPSNVAAPVSVWLRPPPKHDLLAERVHQLIDIEKQSFRAAAKTLQSEGHAGNSGVAWQHYHRYYEMTGQPVPALAYNNGHPRKSRGP